MIDKGRADQGDVACRLEERAKGKFAELEKRDDDEVPDDESGKEYAI